MTVDARCRGRPHVFYIQRCRRFLEVPPPPDWDGVYAMTSKWGALRALRRPISRFTFPVPGPISASGLPTNCFWPSLGRARFHGSAGRRHRAGGRWWWPRPSRPSARRRDRRQFVADQSTRRGLRCITARVAVRPTPGRGTRAPDAARELRRSPRSAGRREAAAAVLTAHALDDQAETMRLEPVAGARGPTGLGGMSPARALPGIRASSWRALPGRAKRFLLAYLRSRRIPFASTRPTRSRVCTQPFRPVLAWWERGASGL